jgi:hypothetical protein
VHRFCDPTAKLLKVDEKISCLTPNRGKLIGMASLQLKKKKRLDSILAVFEDIQAALLTLDDGRLLAGHEPFVSAAERATAITELLEKIRSCVPEVKTDGCDT